MTDPLDRIEEWTCDGYVHDQLAAAGIDVLALVAVARAAREQAHEHPDENWGYDAAGIHFYEDEPVPGCPLCAALARLGERS